MKEFITKDYYSDFINNCLLNLESTNRHIHTNFNLLYAYKQTLDTNYDRLLKYTVTHNIDELLSKSTNTNHYPRTYVETKDLEFINTYNQFIDIINDTRSMIVLSKRYSYLAGIPFKIYKSLLYSIGQETAVEILKGNSITFPKIGNIYVIRVPYKSTRPDWKESLKFKKYLEDNGIETQSKDNPNGKAWLVDNGLNRNDFWLVHWSKQSSRIRYKGAYQLKTTSWDNTDEGIPNITFTKESCINNNKISIFTRLMYLYRNFYDETFNQYPFIYNIKQKK